jgi:hypothetical protein
MAWEYLKTEQFDIRYKIAAEHLPENKVILDLNCGEPNFRKFIKHKKYIANDVFIPDDITGVEFWKMEDHLIDLKSDIIVIFGYGGGEFTGEPLESNTAGESLVRLAEKYHPEYIAIEMVQKWQSDFNAMGKIAKNLRDVGYKMIFNKKMSIVPVTHYHNKRLLRIFKLNERISKTI